MPERAFRRALELIRDNKLRQESFLDLSKCGNLMNIPDEITRLSPWLQQLNISRTKISNLMPLNSFEKLEALNVSHTQVSDLLTLSDLKSLKSVYISNTQVSDLTPLAELPNLEWLCIANTKVSDLSPLEHLIRKGLPVKWDEQLLVSDGIYFENVYIQAPGIYIQHCSPTNPPIEVIKQGNAAILNYFRAIEEQGVDYLYEAKLLIVGEGGAGKTSLLRRLYQPNEGLPEGEDTTKGIDIHQHSFKLNNGRDFRLNVWDFGGQQIYYATHQFFLTKRSLYILLDDTRKGDENVHDPVFKYWLEIVDLLSDHSPLLIFQNEKGGRNKLIDRLGIRSKFSNVKEFYRGDLQKQDSVDKLRQGIEHFAQDLPHIGEELPAQWVKIRADIEQEAQQHATISREDYFAIYKRHLPFDRNKALYLSRYLHDLGVFLHFQDEPLLARTVILQNMWATEAVFKILDDETVKKKWGRFTTEDCHRVWQDSIYADKHLELLALMEQFDLCYLVPDETPKMWIAPRLLKPSKPNKLRNSNKAGDLVLRYKYVFLPKGVVNRLMVRLHRYVSRPEMAWNNGVLFERDSSTVLADVASSGNEIVLRARGAERKELINVVSAELDALNATFHGLQDEGKLIKLVPCHCSICRESVKPEFFQYHRLLKRKADDKETIECPSSYEDVSVLNLLNGIDIPPEKKPRKLFISYSKHDSKYKDTLLKQLSVLRDRVVTWHDRDLLAGEDWDGRIKEELKQADIVLYLVSANSMATDYIQKVELPLIKQRHKNKECHKNKEFVLIPVIVDFCSWQELEFAKLNVLPKKGIPITHKSWTNQNEAWLEVVEGIQKANKLIDC